MLKMYLNTNYIDVFKNILINFVNTFLHYFQDIVLIHSIYLSIYILIKLWSSWLYVCMIDFMFEAVRTNPGYGMAALIYNNLLNLILGTVMLLRSS